VIHIAGNEVLYSGKYLRQRCAWCGIVLIDVDVSQVMFVGDGDSAYPTWPIGKQVEVNGNCTSVVEGLQLPDDSCVVMEMSR
jgi:hypothetical protein